jgi:2-iminobutanoate/2-iminopropanoate deaminase
MLTASSNEKRRKVMTKRSVWGALAIMLALCAASQALAQGFEVKRHTYSAWTKGLFTEVVTVTTPGKLIYLAGVGAEEENKPQGSIRDLGHPYEQCKYAYDKIKRSLAKEGATLADVVKQVVYVTDIRYQADVGKCRKEEYGENSPIPANTFLVIGALAIPGMLLEIDVTAAVAK